MQTSVTAVTIPMDSSKPIIEHPRTFSASESDIIFNMDYKTDGVDFGAVADWLESITGKTTTADDVKREFNERL